MSLVEILILLLVAALCGAIAQAITGYSHGGCLVAIVIGFIGALLGNWLAHQIGVADFFAVTVAGVRIPILWTIIGAALFCGLLQLLGRRSP
jgi:uncharacterized membrane protein YeaQ/YmgE (transglycosylase-associated protein family)